MNTQQKRRRKIMITEGFKVNGQYRLKELQTYVRANMSTARFLRNAIHLHDDIWDVAISYEIEDINKLGVLQNQWIELDDPKSKKKNELTAEDSYLKKTLKRWAFFIMITILLLLFACTASAQITYSMHPDFISTDKPDVNIIWMESAPRNCTLYLAHNVTFINVKADSLTGSKVKLTIMKNFQIFKSYELTTGDQIKNLLSCNIPLKKGDRLEFYFHLDALTKEKYIFNIYDPITPKQDIVTNIPKKVTNTLVKTYQPTVYKNDRNLTKIRRNRTFLSLANILFR